MTKAEESYTSDRYDALQDSYNIIAYRLDPRPTLEEIRRNLLNMFAYDADKDAYYRPEGVEAKFEENGIEELMLELRARLAVPHVLSKLDNNDIKMIVRQCGEITMEFIFMKGDKYNIKESDYSDIFYLIWHSVFSFLKRAEGGTENELVSKGFIHREVVSKTGRTSEEGQTSSPTNLNFFRGAR